MKKLTLLLSMIFMILSVAAEKLESLIGTIAKDGKNYVLKTEDKTYTFDKKLKGKAKKLVDKSVKLSKIEVEEEVIKKAKIEEDAEASDGEEDKKKKKKKKKKKSDDE